MKLSSSGPLRLPLPQARHATVLSLFLLLFFMYANAGNWYCGSDVYSTVKSLCNSCYAGYDKRTGQHVRTIDPFVEPKNAVDFLKRGSARSSRRGIVDECCHKRCSTQEMMFYCCEDVQREYFTFVGWLKRR